MNQIYSIFVDRTLHMSFELQESLRLCCSKQLNPILNIMPIQKKSLLLILPFIYIRRLWSMQKDLIDIF
jgi:hypothetical protein